jgi:Xaa-Pro aminopeptidase
MSHAPTAALDARHRTIREALAARSLDALVVTSLPNVLYLTNFTGSSAIVVLTRDALHFITDFRYVTVLAEAAGSAHDCPGLELVKVDGAYDATLAELLKSVGGKVGFEGEHLMSADSVVVENAGVSRVLAPRAGLHRGSSSARLVKDEFETSTLREAGVACRAWPVRCPPEIRAGRSEREVAMAIGVHLHEAGFSKPAFDTIVASGPNSAAAAARPRAKVPRK